MGGESLVNIIAMENISNLHIAEVWVKNGLGMGEESDEGNRHG